VLLGREFGWTIDEMRQLTPRELAVILNELQRQTLIEEYNEQRNRWNFLAAVMMNGFSALATVFGGKRRRPKLVGPDDFIDKKAKELFQQLLGQDEPGQKQNQETWSKHIKDARAKGLRGPWNGGEKAC
jgi:hypothetical protein